MTPPRPNGQDGLSALLTARSAACVRMDIFSIRIYQQSRLRLVGVSLTARPVSDCRTKCRAGIGSFERGVPMIQVRDVFLHTR